MERMTYINRRDGVMKRYIDKHGIARKGDKLDIVAMGFENKTTAIFDECLSDDDFHQLFLDNACESIDIIVAKLSEYAESNLI